MKKLVLLLLVCFYLLGLERTNAQNCDTSKVAYIILSPGPFPPTNVLDFICLDSAIQLHVSPFIDCNSIAADGSNFYIEIPYFGKVKAVFAEAENCIGDSSNTILIRLEKPLFINMLGALHIKESSSQTTIKSNCAQRPWVNDSINVFVQGCFVTKFDKIEAVQNSSSEVSISWEMKESTPLAPFPVYLFAAYNIYRKTTQDNQFQLIDSVTTYSDMRYTDANLPPNYIGNIDYLVSIKLLHLELAFSDTARVNVISRSTPTAFPVPFQNHLEIALANDESKEISIFSSEGKLIFS